MKKINGNTLSRNLLGDLKSMIERIQKESNLRDIQYSPRLGIICVGDHPASLSYIRKKKKIARKVGIKTRLFQIPLEKETALQETIKKLNNSKKYHGILLQLPLPQPFSKSEQNYLNLIDPIKDVDCLTDKNREKLEKLGEKADIIPPTPLGILKMLDSKKINLSGKEAVMIGKGKLVGQPLSKLLHFRGANIMTFDVKDHIDQITKATKTADIIFTATGIPDLINDSHIKKGSIVIDIGVCRNPENPSEIRGDILQQTKHKKCRFYSPVPKGVGPMTVNSLMFNVVQMWKKQLGL